MKYHLRKYSWDNRKGKYESQVHIMITRFYLNSTSVSGYSLLLILISFFNIANKRIHWSVFYTLQDAKRKMCINRWREWGVSYSIEVNVQELETISLASWLTAWLWIIQCFFSPPSYADLDNTHQAILLVRRWRESNTFFYPSWDCVLLATGLRIFPDVFINAKKWWHQIEEYPLKSLNGNKRAENIIRLVLCI